MPIELHPPLPPMEATSVGRIPTGDKWQYEPKWDGFRCLVFRDSDRIELQSKSGRPFTRYFPELVAAIAALKARRFVLDGEIVVPSDSAFSFDDLLQRIHPAETRIRKLAAETPATLIVFDLLADVDGRALLSKPLDERRTRLDQFAHRFLVGDPRIRLSPMSVDHAEAERWLRDAGTNLDGVIAKLRDAEARRRGLLRPLQRRSLPARHQAPALAARQAAPAMHDGAGTAAACQTPAVARLTSTRRCSLCCAHACRRGRQFHEHRRAGPVPVPLQSAGACDLRAGNRVQSRQLRTLGTVHP